MSVLEAFLCPKKMSIALEHRAKKVLRGMVGVTSRRRQEGEGREREKRGGETGMKVREREEGEEERLTD